MPKYSGSKWRWIMIVVALCYPTGICSGAEISEKAIKASYILKLRQFVKVGSPARPVRTMCYYEQPNVPYEESVGQIMAKYAAQNAASSGHEFSVKWIKAIRNLSASGCDIFYIPDSESGDIDNILTSLDNAPTLTISAADKFIFRGGMLGFVADDNNRIKMTANLENISKRGVWIDASILEIMDQVVGTTK